MAPKKVEGILKMDDSHQESVAKETPFKNGKIANGHSNGKVVDTALKLPAEIGTDYSFKREIVWFNAIGFLMLHTAALIGLFLAFKCHILTVLWALAVALVSGEGVTIGAHRLYSHKSFKATWIMRLTLLVLHTMAGQNCMYIWVRDHRQHHKYSDTDADPHNANRGFFFSHVGWLMSKKHPAVLSKGKTIDMSDLEADHLVMIQKEYYKPLYVVFALAIPVAIPVYLWNETYINSLFVGYFLRYVIVLNFTWLVNSAAHKYGTKPFDKNMLSVESIIVSFVAIGEGWHNYHHAFPWDYRASEFGKYFNFTTKIIDFCAWLRLCYDLKSAPLHMVENRAKRTGDGSHAIYGKGIIPSEPPSKVEESAATENIEEPVNLENGIVGVRPRHHAVQG